MLESTGYTVSSHTKKNWVIFTPKNKNMVFKRETVLCKGMPYTDLCNNKAGSAIIKTVQVNNHLSDNPFYLATYRTAIS